MQSSLFNPRRHKPKNVARINRTLPSTFKTIHPIDIVFGTYNEIPLCFQLRVTTRCLNFQILFKFELNTEDGEKTLKSTK